MSAHAYREAHQNLQRKTQLNFPFPITAFTTLSREGGYVSSDWASSRHWAEGLSECYSHLALTASPWRWHSLTHFIEEELRLKKGCKKLVYSYIASKLWSGLYTEDLLIPSLPHNRSPVGWNGVVSSLPKGPVRVSEISLCQFLTSFCNCTCGGILAHKTSHGSPSCPSLLLPNNYKGRALKEHQSLCGHYQQRGNAPSGVRG